MQNPTIDELQKMYDAVHARHTEPDMVVTTTALARKHMLPEEVAIIDAFLAANPGKNWHLDRKTLIVTEC